MNVYLDDMRQGPHYEGGGPSDPVDWHNWVIVRSIANAKRLLMLGLVNDLSLDHDLGTEETGYDLCKWMAENNCWPTGQITIHSANPVGAKNMKEFIDRYRT